MLHVDRNKSQVNIIMLHVEKSYEAEVHVCQHTPLKKAGILFSTCWRNIGQSVDQTVSCQ